MAATLFGLFGRSAAGAGAARAPTVADVATPGPRTASAQSACDDEPSTEHQARKRPLLPAGIPDASHCADGKDRGGGESDGAPRGSEHAAIGTTAVASSGGDDGARCEAAPCGAECQRPKKKPKHSRTPAAVKERHKKQKAKRKAAAAAAPRERAAEAVPTARERALEQALRQSEKLLRLARRSKRRDGKTAWQRGRQLERRTSKQAKTQKRKRGAKLERSLAGAARRERDRERRGKQPVGEALHTGERTHKRKLSEAQLRAQTRQRLDSYKSHVHGHHPHQASTGTSRVSGK